MTINLRARKCTSGFQSASRPVPDLLFIDQDPTFPKGQYPPSLKGSSFFQFQAYAGHRIR